MKLIHLSDLHLGKRVNEYSMLEDQRFILSQILDVIDSEKPECVMIAGDVYDKSVPSAEAVQLFDEFLSSLSERRLQVFVISGNHDSPERIAFGSRLMHRSGIHLSPVYDGHVEPIVLKDEFGEIAFFMLPFVKPVHVRRFSEQEILSYTDAIRAAVDEMKPNFSGRNVLITHQFVTGASRSDSEEISVGGTDNVDVSVFDGFDYVALGHIHSPQNCGSQRVRYCGTPLKYSFSEVADIKSVTIAEFGEKGNLQIRTAALAPMRDLVELKGKYAEVTARSFYIGKNWQEDYVHITLTDEEDIPDAIGKLRTIYHNLMKLDYDNMRTRSATEIDAIADVERLSPLKLFADFYELQNNQPMSDWQMDFMTELIEKTGEAE